jgi:DNA (cytosine-5)-methyltransferase 1
MGYHRAGFDVVGVDINPQPDYPFEFHQVDWTEAPGSYDAIHASPPCQAYSVLRRANPGAEYPDLINPVRALLQASGLPWIIENVPGAPLEPSVVLCGSMFGLGSNGRHLRRHRLFESPLTFSTPPPCDHSTEAIGVYGGGAVARYTFENGAKARNGRRGGYQGSVAEKREAMGIDWMSTKALCQSIPPAYTEWVGKQLLDVL